LRGLRGLRRRWGGWMLLGVPLFTGRYPVGGTSCIGVYAGSA